MLARRNKTIWTLQMEILDVLELDAGRGSEIQSQVATQDLCGHVLLKAEPELSISQDALVTPGQNGALKRLFKQDTENTETRNYLSHPPGVNLLSFSFPLPLCFHSLIASSGCGLQTRREGVFFSIVELFEATVTPTFSFQ